MAPTDSDTSEAPEQPRPIKRQKKEGIVNPVSDRLSDYAEMVTVLVGEKAKPMYFHKNKICESSTFFKKACNGEWTEAKNKTVSLQHCDEKIFSTYIHWLYEHKLDLQIADPDGSVNNEDGGEADQHVEVDVRQQADTSEEHEQDETCPGEKQTSGDGEYGSEEDEEQDERDDNYGTSDHNKPFHILLECYILGDLLGDERFLNDLTNVMILVLDEGNYMPSAHVISYFWSRLPENSPMGDLLVDNEAACCDEDKFDDCVRVWPYTFFVRVAKRLLEWRNGNGYRPRIQDLCHYHRHIQTKESRDCSPPPHNERYRKRAYRDQSVFDCEMEPTSLYTTSSSSASE